MNGLTPLLDHSLQGARAGDEACVLGAVDMLTEMGVTLTDVLALYAGEPHEWEDIAPPTVLALWLRLHNDVVRAAQVEQPSFRRNGAPVFRDYWTGINWDEPIWRVWKSPEAAQRYVKRRTLSLFPECVATRQVSLSKRSMEGRTGMEWNKAMNDLMSRNGMDSNHSARHTCSADGDILTWRQDVPAQRWVPPHAEEHSAGGLISADWGNSTADVASNLRSVREEVYRRQGVP